METPSRDLSEEIRCLARQAAADLGIPFSQVNLLRLAHWLAQKSEACAEKMR